MTLSATITLCQQLIQQPSVTPADFDCQQLLGQRYAKAGFTLETMTFGDVTNLWARIGTEGPLLVFAGHTDVVPTGDESQWRYPPFSAEINEGHIFGRGAADMKGGVAAFTTAIERFLAGLDENGKSLKGSIGVLLTSDEEGPALDGTKRVIETLEARGEKIDWCIVGEPTSTTTLGDVIKNGRRGSLSATLTVDGTQGHVAYPHLADNPIHRALSALDQLVSIEWDKGNRFFPATSLQISNIHAGTGAGNVIPGELEVRFNLRFSTELNAVKIQERVKSLLDSHDFNYTIDWQLSGNPFITEPADLTDMTQQAIKEICGISAQLETGGGTSDGRFIAPTGAQVIELGPLNHTIHQVNECVSINDLDQLSAVYERVLELLETA